MGQHFGLDIDGDLLAIGHDVPGESEGVVARAGADVGDHGVARQVDRGDGAAGCLLPEDIRLDRAFYLVRHQDDARVARINRMAEVVVDWMRLALSEGGA